MRKTGLNTIYSMAKEDKNILFIGSDLGKDTLPEFKSELPNQFFMEGISEANIVSMSSGLAQEGFKVYINTIATFFTRRAFEQIALDVYSENLDIVIYGNGGGLVYGPLGHSHTAVDDFALFYPLSDMTILAPSDAHEMESLMKQTKNFPGPVYIRLGKGGDKVVTKDFKPLIGKALFFDHGGKGKKLICTTGIMLQRALEISSSIPNCDVLHFSTVQPIDRKALIDKAQEYKEIIVLEEHLKNGGLGTRIIDELFRENIRPEKFKHYHLGENYIKTYGRQEEIFDQLKISPEHIIKSL
ncbi:MAG: transketolase [Bacteriovoracaceae bacterium]|jgi:transketolase|nr:transketolase [Bacteriovoracaceae bacterium]